MGGRSSRYRVRPSGRVLALLAMAAAGCAARRPVIASRPPGTIVALDAGTIEGVLSGDVLAFRGIPYAAPPVGPLRWRAPQPVTPWRGVRPALHHGLDCMQKPIPVDAAASGKAFGEDCLFVNVWRPAPVHTGVTLPVLVWFHGGGFLNGGSASPVFDGSALAREGLVVVTLNYRLGRLGFFAHPSLKAGDEAVGNFAFLDQLAALQWVQRNIAAFGGDAGQVTIAGESAGGISVMHLLTWPAAGGLFQRAVVMSGGGRTYLVPETGAVPRAQAEKAGLAFAQSMGIAGTGVEALEALRALPAEKVGGDLSMEALTTRPDTYAGGPILDGRNVTGMPADSLRTGTAARVPVLIGTTSDDLPVLFPPRNDPLSFFGAEAAAAKAVYLAGATDRAAAIRNIAVDRTMHEPARFVARKVTAAGQPAWLYRFGYVAESWRPKGTAEHSTEVPYLFGTLDARSGPPASPRDRAMADAFRGYLAAFARTGDPNRSGLPPWPRYDAARSELMTFTPDAAAVVQADPWKSRLDLVEHASDAPAAATEAAGW